MQDFTKKVGVTYDKITSPVADVILYSWLKGKFRASHIWIVIRYMLFAAFVATPVFWATAATAVGGPFAIGYSFWALFYQSDVSYLRVIVLISTLGLLVAVCWNPIGVVMRNLFASASKEDQNSDPAKQVSSEEAEPS